ncbi:MAG TPA: molybdopterin cofactor-binding domain-containing protein [Clostridia bacterium]|nr:molybdopterin cofactor-binding domain-containing protein [Clostridia bacterium]
MPDQQQNYIGANVPIAQAALKATGQMMYTADMKLPHMLHAKVLFSPRPHARIVRIDTSRAEALPGVHAVITHLNTPTRYYNSCGEVLNEFMTEQLFSPVVRYVGDKVAAVAADTEKIAEAALKLIDVEYKDLPANYDPEQALDENAYVIHDHGELERGNLILTVAQSSGDVDVAMAKADHIFSDVYECPAIHHGAMETHAALAVFDAEGMLTVYTPSQDTFAKRRNLATIFDLPMSKVRVSVPAIGGAFGGKIDLITEPIAAALAMKTGRPVRLVYNRTEDICSTRNRHAMRLYLRTGVMNDGTIVAEDMRAYVNAGAYASGTTSVVWAMCGRLFKVHQCPNVRFVGYPVITNTTIGGPMRGFGSPQLFFAQQRQMNTISKALGIDMLELQRKNLTTQQGADPRNQLPHGNARPIDCLNRAAERIGYDAACAEQQESTDGRYRIGVGIGVGAHGNGMYGVKADITGLMLKMNCDGTCVLFTPSNEMGNSSVTLQKQMVAETLGMPLSDIDCVEADTRLTPYQLGDYSSRGTFVSGHGALKIATSMQALLAEVAGRMLGVPADSLRFTDRAAIAADGRRVSLEEIVLFARDHDQKELLCAESFASQAAVMSYGAHIAKVRVDTDTGEVKVLSYAAIHDVGKAINPLSVTGQIEGALQMGLGNALSEDMGVDEKTGAVKNRTLKRYKMLYAGDMPRELAVEVLDSFEPAGPFGAKSIGECSVVPTLSAIGNAIANAIGAEVNSLPITKDKILEALAKKATEQV